MNGLIYPMWLLGSALTVLLSNLPTAAGQEHVRSASVRSATLRVCFSYRGVPPVLPLIDSSGDALCADCDIPDQRLVVSQSGALRDVALIWDERRNRELKAFNFPAFEEQVCEMQFKNCRLQPRLVVARAGQALVINHEDRAPHSAHVNFFLNSPRGILIPLGAPHRYQLNEPEPAPLPVECNIHPWEKAWLIVKEHPYIGVSDSCGALIIEDLPVGNNWFRIWHESLDVLEAVTINGEVRAVEKNRIALELVPGVNDLGTIELESRHFDRLFDQLRKKP